MNILFPIGSYYPSQQGGPCNSVHALAKGLVKAGHKVQVVTTNFDIPESAGIPFDQWTKVDGIDVYYITRPQPTNSIMRFDLLLLTHPALLTDILKEQRPDVIHTTMLFTIMSHRAAQYAKKQKIPLLWSPRGSMMSDAFGRSSLKKKLFLSLPFVKHGLQQAHFHATSPEEAADIANWMKWYTGEEVAERTTIIPNIMSDEVFTPGGDTSPYPYKYILYLGRIHPIKKLENLIEAFAKMQPLQPHPPQAVPLLRSAEKEIRTPSPHDGEGRGEVVKGQGEVRLVIAGWTGEDAEYTRSLKLRVEQLRLGDRVVFTEKRVEGMDKATLYRHAEVFVLPSESENFGMVVIESLAQGVPVIASNKTPWQVLAERGAGFWPANDPASLAESLNKFFSSNDAERRQLSAKATALAQEYGNEALIGKYVKMYEDIARNAHDKV